MPYCTPCRRTFLTAAAVRQHLAASSVSIHPYCPECNRNFVSEHALEQHLGTRRCRRVYCRDCKRSFVRQSALNQHRDSSVHSSNLGRIIVVKEALTQCLEGQGQAPPVAAQEELPCDKPDKESSDQTARLPVYSVLWKAIDFRWRAFRGTLTHYFLLPVPPRTTGLQDCRPPEENLVGVPS